MNKRDIAFAIFVIALLAVLVWLGRYRTDPPLPWLGVGLVSAALMAPALAIYAYGVARDGSRGQQLSRGLLQGIGSLMSESTSAGM